ncbi:DUF4347 domain-containing protein [Roseomonas frigidaquae]|uniref:DUF4347 domain-containing protein n=2 Tax=Falsiroseomonas frigidaquae TaxID=487318 RepID=A0ABX1F5S6_9PROT|nr:DUF4347 domain-containing protein [Falsiroseomonas frigidaquae]NKE47732.1 DUF4347 domain-containing protein [Falsiroseomonas frigidaquae]
MSDIQADTCTNSCQSGADHSAGAARQAVAVIDCAVSGWQSLRDALPAGIEAILIQPGQDGLAAMVAGLSGRHGIAALHILSHGFAGGMQLGSTTLDRAALPARRAELASIGASLAADGDILIYSCSVASGAGEAFLEDLAEITGADLAASRSLTGAAELGGNWDLEWTRGVVATQALRIETFSGVLLGGPIYSSTTAYVGEEFLTLAFDRELDAANPPEISAFLLGINGTNRAVSAVEVVGSTVKVTFSGALTAGDVIDITYSDPSGGNDAYAIQDTDGEDAETVNPVYTVLGPRPLTFETAEVNGQFLTLTYPEALASLPAANAGNFIVMVEGNPVTVNSVLVDGPAGTVTLVLDQAVVTDQIVSVAYNDPSGSNDTYAIQTPDGMDAASIGQTNVLNVTVVPTGPTPPVATANAFRGTASDAASTAVAVFQDVTVDVVDSDQLITGMVLKVHQIAGAGEILTINSVPYALATQSGSSGPFAYDVNLTAGVATITLTGLALTAADAVTFIEGITYTNSTGALSAGETAVRPIVLESITDDGPVDFNTTQVNLVGTVTIADSAAPNYALTATAIDPTITFEPGTPQQVEFLISVDQGLSLVGSMVTITPSLPEGWSYSDFALYEVNPATLSETAGSITGIIAANTLYKAVFNVTSSGTDNGGSFPVSIVATAAGFDVNTAMRSASAMVTVEPADEVPTLVATGGTPDFVGGATDPVDLFSAVTASVVDVGQVFTSLQFTVSGIVDANETIVIEGVDVLLAAGTTVLLPGLGVSGGDAGVSVAVSNGTATIDVTGLALDNTAMGSLVDALGYKNLTSNATIGDRVITVTQLVDDGVNATGTITGISATVTVTDETPPTVVSIERQTPTDEATNADVLVWRVTLSEAVQNIDASDFTVTGTTATVTNVVSAGGNAYDVTVSGGDLATVTADVTLSFAVLQNIEDQAEQTFADVTPTGDDESTYTVDNTPPAVPAFTGIEVNEGSLILSGTGEAGATLVLRPLGGGSETATLEIGQDGSWSTPVLPIGLGMGLNMFDILSRDAVGNESAVATGVAQFQNDAPAALLEGGTGNDVLLGNVGADTLEGGAGADWMNGAGGVDTADYSASTGAVQVDLSTGTGTGGDAEGDTLVGIENLVGSAEGDVLTGDGEINVLSGGAGDDTLNGGAGDDTLMGGQGDDAIYGGEGFDIVDYSAEEGELDVDLDDGDADVDYLGYDDDDDLYSIEGVIGTNNDDTLRGSDVANLLDGGEGDDRFYATLGADTLIGGDGIDQVRYTGSNFDAGVVISLDPLQQSGGAAAGHVLTEIEHVVGSSGDDWVIGDVSGVGSNVDNVFEGRSGDDILDGGFGDDTLIGGDGNNLLLGGEGNDTAVYEDREQVIEVRLDLGYIEHGGGTDEVVSIENVVAGIGNDLMIGDAADNVFEGGDGNDTLEGGIGNDQLIGGEGTDTASYANAKSGVTAALGNFQIGGFGIQANYSPNTGEALGDTYDSIENLTGSVFADALYGNAEDNVLRGLAGSDALYGGEGNDTLEGGVGMDAMHGGDGFDIASYENAASAVNASLVSFRNSAGFGATDESGRDSYNSIEGLRGSIYFDALTGNDGDNLLQGLAGNDLLVGGAGDDTIEGGAGSDVLSGDAGVDTASYASSDAAVTINLATSSARGGHAQGDSLGSIENVTGSAHDDSLTGDTGANLLMGGAGNDTLVGGAGADTLDGGEGYDTADYATSTDGVKIDMLDASQSTGDAAEDVFVSIENLLGGSGNDTLLGDGQANRLDGGDGDDFISGRGTDDVMGAAGDQLIGGAGNDTVSYEWDSVGVFVHLGMNLASHDDGDDTLSGFENAIGGSGNDDIHGSAEANMLGGGDGSDTLQGNDGADTLDGGAGNNSLDGGEGNDVVDYGAASASSVVFNTNLGEVTRYDGMSVLGVDTLSNIETLGATTGTSDLIDGSTDTRSLTIDLGAGTFVPGVGESMTVTGFEHADGGSADDVITGSTAANLLSGGDGADTLAGGAGNDTLDGGDGIDTADYSASAEAVSINLATSTNSGGDAEGDLLGAIENITGSAHDDLLVGDDGANLLSGGAGNDTLAGGGGADTLQGGAGNDVFLIDAAADHAIGEVISGGEGLDAIRFISGTASTLSLGDVTGVEVVLASDATGDLTGTTALNIDATGLAEGVEIALVGNAGSNVLTGNDNGSSWLLGGAGNDTLIGGAAADTLTGGSGADLLTGNGGIDWADYSGSTAGVSVNLKDQVQALGDAQGDTLSGIENVIGSDGNDFIRGDAADNDLLGGTGNDSLQGFEGNDTLEGGAGADELIGGAGTDFASYRAALAGVVVDLTLTRSAAGDAVGDVFLSIENLEGSTHDDVLVGDGLANALVGGAGNDTLIGGAGKDILTGGEGADVFAYGAVSDSLATPTDRDLITDWGMGDRIDLSGFDANTVLGGFQSFVYRGATTNYMDAAAGEVWTYVLGGNTYVIAGVDAGATRDFQIQITGEHSLQASDFLGVNALLAGTSGRDALTGGAGNDTLTGGSGRDTLTGGEGADQFVYTQASDSLATPTGRDVITDWGMGDQINLSGFDANTGLGGVQSFVYRGATTNYTEAAAGELWSYVLGGNTYVIGGVDAGIGRDFQIEITGVQDLQVSDFMGVAGLLAGSSGDDVLNGGSGHDTLSGAAGNDTLFGGAGKDILTGGEGADVFVYTQASDSRATPTGRDVITDWSTGDLIDLSGFDANTLLGGEQSFVYQGATTNYMDAAAGELWSYVLGGNTYVIAGVDAGNTRDFQIEITGAHNLQASDFIL